MKKFKSFLTLYLNMRAISYVCSHVWKRGTSIYESEHVHVCVSVISEAFYLVF